MNNWIWIGLAGLILYINQNARTVSINIAQGSWTRAQRLYRALDGFARALCGWTVIFLIVGLALLIVSIFVSTQIAQSIRIIAIWLLVAWVVILYITLRLAAGVVETALNLTGESFASQRETIVNALKVPHQAGAIVLALLVAWAFQVYVWPAMPAFVGSFVVFIILLWIIAGIATNKPPNPEAAKTWAKIACVIFGMQIIAFYLAHGDDLVSRKFQNWRASLVNAAQDESYAHGVHGLVKTFSTDNYRHFHNGNDPIVMEFVGDSMEFVDDYGKLDNREFGLFEGNPPERIRDYVQKRFGRLKVVVFESLPSRQNPVVRRYIAPVDCFTGTPSRSAPQVAKGQAARARPQPPTYIAGLKMTGLRTKADVILAKNWGFRFDEAPIIGKTAQISSPHLGLVWVITDGKGKEIQGPYNINTSAQITEPESTWFVARTIRGPAGFDAPLELKQW